MASASTDDASAALELPRLVRELVEAACPGLSLSDAASAELAALEPGGSHDGAELADVRRLLAIDVGWTLAAHETDLALAARRRASLLARAGDPSGSATAWLEAAELAAAQDDHGAARGDVEAALGQLATGHDTDAPSSTDAALSLLERTAQLATRLGHRSAHHAWQLVASEAAARSEPERAAHALHQAWCACDDDDAVLLLERAVALGSGGGWAARCAAVLAFLDDRIEESEQHAERALQWARRNGDRPLEALALHGIACARSVGGDLSSAITVQRQALAMAQAIGDARTLDSGSLNLVVMLQDDLRSDEAIAAQERMHASRLASGEPGPIVESLALRAALLQERGDLGAAEALLEPLLADGGCDGCEPLARAHVAFLSLLVGVDAGHDPARLDALGSSVRAAAVATGMGSLATRAGILDAIRAFDLGDVDVACDALLQLEAQENGVLAAELAVALARSGLAARRSDCIDRGGALLSATSSTARITRIARRELEAARAMLDAGRHDDLCTVAHEWHRRDRPIDAGRLLLAGAGAAGDARTRAALATRAAALLAAAGARGPAGQARRLAIDHDDDRRIADPAAAALFDGVDARVRDELLRHAVDVRRPQGSVLHDPDDELDTAWIVRSGRVRLCRVTDDERRLTVELLDPGSVLGEHALLGLPQAGTLAECEEPVVLAALPIARLAAASTRCPRLAANLLQLAGTRMERSRQLAERVAFWTVDRRMARCLLDLDAQYGRPTLDGHRMVERSFTHFQLAELVNARRETVGEFLKRMRAEGIVELRRRRLVLLDHRALQAIVDAT